MLIHRIITQFLIINIVFSNFAWAMDECAYFLENPDQDISLSVSNSNISPSDDDSNTVICDSHCFVNAMLFYVSYNLPEIKFFDTSSKISSIQASYYSIQRHPPTKPPRV